MKHARLLVAAAVAVAVLAIALTARPTEAVCNAGMSYGDVMDCSISAAYEVDTFTFSGTSGEKVLFRMAGLFYPTIVVKRPDGTQLCTRSTYQQSSIECVLDATGTFSILASEPYGYTGNYKLYIAVTSSPPTQTPVAISYGDVTTGTIAALKWYPFTFSGTSGEKVLVRLSEVSSALYPEMKLRRPDGTTLCYGSSYWEVQTECTLDATGTFTAWVHSSGTETGDFKLYLAVTSTPPTESTTAIAYGDILSGLTQGEMRWYPLTFSGTSGEKVLVRVMRTSGTYLPLMSLRRPAGTQLCPGGGGYNQSEFTVECTLDATGTHTIWLAASSGLTSGAYSIYLAVTSSPTTETATAIAYGDVLTGQSQVAMRVKPFTFSGTSGEKVLIRVQRTAGGGYYDYNPIMVLRRPAGTDLCYAAGDYSYGHIQIECTLDATGTHTIWMSAPVGSNTGTYQIYLARMSATISETPTSMTYGDLLTSQTQADMRWKPYTFSGTSGEKVYIAVQAFSGTGSYLPAMVLRRPSGSDLCSVVPFQAYWYKECTLDATGTYTIWMRNQYAPGTGTFNLHLTRISSPYSETSAPITYGSSVVVSASALRWYPFTFNGASGDKLNITAVTGNPWYPYVRLSLNRPDATNLCNGYGSVYSAPLTCTLDVTGVHTLWVGTSDPVSLDITTTLVQVPILGASYSCNLVADPSFPSAQTGGVNPTSGDFTHSADISVPGRGVPLDFKRTYHSGMPIVRALGKGWTHNWDMYVATSTCGGDVGVFYPDGHGSGFVASGGGSYDAPDGNTDTLVKNGNNTYTLTTKSKYVYQFSTAGKLTSVVDRNGNTTSLSYDGSGNLQTVTDPGGRTLTFTTSGGKITQIALPLTRTVTFSYTGDQLTSVTDVAGGTTTYAYNSSGITSVTDPNSHAQITQIFDSDGRVAEQTDAVSGKTCYKYGWGASYTSAGCPSVSPAPNSSQTIVVDARGNKTTYEYDGHYQTIKITNALAGVTEFTYNGEHRPLTVKDPLNHTTTYTYDSAGNVLTKTDPLSHVWTYTYNAFNDVLTATDPLSHVVTHTYDGSGNLATTVDANSKTTTYTVDGNGQVTVVTDPLSHATTYGYDSYGDRTTVTDALSKTWTSAYDLGGRVTSVTDPLSHVTSYTYNARGQVLTETNHLSQVTTTTYDTKGNKATVTDANSKVTTWNYDNADRLASLVDPASQTESYAYDANGNRTSLTNVRSKTTSYAYDALNRRTTVTDPLSNVETTAYDAASRVTQLTDGRGLKTLSFYDNANRLTSVEHRLANNTLVDTISYAYDNANRRTSMTDPVGTTTYAFDVVDRTTSVTFPGSSVVGYTYDDASRRTRITYPDSKTVDYTYDNANRMATVTDWLTKQTSYGYDNAGNLSTTTYPNGAVATDSYDNAERLLSVTNAKSGTFSSFTYTLDAVGNRSQVVANNGTTTFAYDNLYRLTSVTYPGPTTDTYTYDAIGNRATKNATTYSYNDGDRMTAAGGVSYGYDGSGNQTSRGSDTYTFDHDQRLTQAVSGGVTSSSVYYGNGVRKSHTVNGVTTTYKYDVLASLPVVIQDGTYSYVYGLDLISMTDGSGNQKYLSYDGLGSVTDITDGSGTVTDTFVYDVFGAVTARTGTSVDAWKFSGEQADDGSGDSGYMFLRARYYDTATGRFVGRDPMEFSQRYAYAGNNPALVTDPSGWCGEWGEEDCGGGGGFGGGGNGSWSWGEWFTDIKSMLAQRSATAGPPAAGQPITFNYEQWAHIIEGHLDPSTSFSRFYLNESDTLQMILEANQETPMFQEWSGNYVRTVDAGRVIGWDYQTRTGTSIFRVVTKPDGTLWTAFPVGSVR